MKFKISLDELCTILDKAIIRRNYLENNRNIEYIMTVD